MQSFPQFFLLPQTSTQFNLFIQHPIQPPPSLQSLTEIPLSTKLMDQRTKESSEN